MSETHLGHTVKPCLNTKTENRSEPNGIRKTVETAAVMKQPGDELVIQEPIAHCCFVSLKKTTIIIS